MSLPDSENGPRWRAVCAAAVAGGLLLRLGIAISPHVSSTSDTSSYLTGAREILAGVWNPFFPVGYQLLVAAVIWGVPLHVTSTLLGLNVVLSTATVGMAALTARRLAGSSRAFAVTAAVLAGWPNQLHYVGLIMSDVAGAFCVTASIWLLAGGFDLLAGAAIATAAVTRTVLSPLVGLGAMLLALRDRRRSLWFGVGSGVPIAAVAALSITLSGVVTIGGNFAFNLDVARRSMGSRIDYRSDSTTTREAVRRYVAPMLRQPRKFMVQRIEALWELWGPWPGGDEPRASNQSPRSGLVRFIIGFRFLLLLAALPSISRVHQDMAIAYLWLIVVTVSAVPVMTFSTPRFSLCAEPALAILIGVATEVMITRRANRNDVAMTP